MSEIFQSWHNKCGCERHKTHLKAADPRVPAEVVLQPARAPAPGHEPLLGGGGVGAALQPGLGPHADRQLALARHVQLLSCVGAAQLGLGAHCAHHGGKLRPGTWNLAGECTAQYSAVQYSTGPRCTAQYCPASLESVTCDAVLYNAHIPRYRDFVRRSCGVMKMEIIRLLRLHPQFCHCIFHYRPFAEYDGSDGSII